MRPTIHIVCSTVLVGLSLLLLGAAIHLTYFFPATLARWAELGQQLTTLQRIVAQSSGFCRAYGLLVFPVLVVLLGLSIFWMTSATNRRE